MTNDLKLAKQILDEVNTLLREKALMLRAATVVDATLLAVSTPSSTPTMACQLEFRI